MEGGESGEERDNEKGRERERERENVCLLSEIERQRRKYVGRYRYRRWG